MTAGAFAYDVFLSHSAKDKPAVRVLAERFKADGLRVWFDEWEIQIGDNIPSKLEHGLENSRILLLCMSKNAFGSDWAMLESQTFRFRDPLNEERRFIPLRLDGTEPKGSLALFRYVDWREGKREEEYPKLVAACRGPKLESIPAQDAATVLVAKKTLYLGHVGAVRSVALSRDGKRALSGAEGNTIVLWNLETGKRLRVLKGHSDSIWSVALSLDGRQVLSGSADRTVQLWDTESGECLRVLEGHDDSVRCVAFSADSRHALSGSADGTVRLWDVHNGNVLRVFDGHVGGVRSVTFRSDVGFVMSAGHDGAIRLWDSNNGKCIRVLEGHIGSVRSVAPSRDGRRALSGGRDRTVRLWDTNSGKCLRVLEGHTDGVRSVALSVDGLRALSGGEDSVMRIWDVESGGCLRVLKGHDNCVWSVTLSPDGRQGLSGAADNTLRLWDVESGDCLRVLEGDAVSLPCVAWSADGNRAVSCGADMIVRLWDVQKGKCLHELKGHKGVIECVASSPDGRLAVSGAGDMTVRLWDLQNGVCLRQLQGHADTVWGIAISPDGQRVLSSGGRDWTVRFWDLHSERCLHVLEGHSGNIWSVALSANGHRALSGAADKTVRLWDLDSGDCLHVLQGHTDAVWSVALSADGRRALSGGCDRTVRLWDLDKGRCLHVFEGHAGGVASLALNADGRLFLSGADDRTVRLWDVASGRCLAVMQGHFAAVYSVAFRIDGQEAYSAAVDGVMRVWDLSDLALPVASKTSDHVSAAATSTQLQYTNAKVLLVGESGAGKTGLSKRLAMNDWQPSDSTVGAWATQWKLASSATDGVEREIWLWDFGGQADQRLIHQLYMDETALAVLVFDGQKEDLFETLGQWDRDMMRASRRVFTKLLVAGRVDAGGLRVSRHQLDAFAKERGFISVLETSAKANVGCEELKRAIINGIRWEDIPWRSSPLLFKQLKDEIIKLRDGGRVLIRFNELRDNLQLILTGEGTRFTDAELKAVVSLLAGPGVVWELKFGSWVLLQPEYVNAYAQAVIQTLRADPEERGCLSEETVLKGELTYQSSMRRLDADEERFVLLAMHQTLVERALCLREHTEKGPHLIFPSFFRRERPDLVGHPAVFVSYQFSGFLDDIYATLVVRLHHTQAFESDELWRYAADFKTLTGKQLGVKLTRRGEGAAELELYFDHSIPTEEKIIFSRYVHEHLQGKANDLIRLRHYVCPHCGTPVGNREVAMKRLNAWLDGRPPDVRTPGVSQTGANESDAPTILCADCERRVPLWDELEECFASQTIRAQVRKLQDQSALVLDNESKERALVGEVISTVALAGQISREKSVSDHGIDMEIEFKDDCGQATGEMLFLQLKSGDSYLRERQHDEAEIFTNMEERYVRYWMSQKFPVMLVIRGSDGTVRWMEVRDWLKRVTENGTKSVRQIEFQGERLDVMSVRRWRDRLLGARASGE